MVKVIANDNESSVELLYRFQEAVEKNSGRPWYKRRYGYYEKPSRLNRKRRKMQRINQAHQLKLHIALEVQFARTGENATGR